MVQHRTRTDTVMADGCAAVNNGGNLAIVGEYIVRGLLLRGARRFANDLGRWPCNDDERLDSFDDFVGDFCWWGR